MPHLPGIAETPESPHLNELCARLVELRTKDPLDTRWPSGQMELCAECGVFRWFIEKEYGGLGWSPGEVAEGYLKLSAACLTTTFVITQRTGACKRIAGSQNESLKSDLLPRLAAGEIFATVGISHLTTSRRYLKQPVLQALPAEGGFVINGFSPWVTGGAHADQIVMGAEQADGKQILFCLPAQTDGIECVSPHSLMALTGSQTGQVNCNNVFVKQEWLLGGPRENVMSAEHGAGAGAGGLQTSMLAVGLAQAATEFLATQSSNRSELVENYDSLHQQTIRLKQKLLAAVEGKPVCTNDELRVDANSLVLRATQSALVAAKGAAYVAGHPVGRWCREALFFLVWSCPQSVSNANLCELAGIID